MKIIVSVERELESWWGAHDFLDDAAKMPVDEQNACIVNIVMDDIGAFLSSGAKWKVARVSDEQPKQSWSGPWRGEEWRVEK